MNYSKTFIGIFASYLVAIGLLSEAEALTLTTGLIMLTPVVYALWARWKTGGINWLGFK